MFQHFENKIIRKLTAVFGTLFNDIKIKRYNASGDVTETMTVPIAYAPKQKWYQAVFAGNDNRPDGGGFALKVPGMGFEMTSMLFDTTRKLNKMNKIRQGNLTDGSLVTGYIGAPYSVDFVLYVFANKTADWTQIIEQIFPYFNPTFNVPIRIVHNEANDQYVVQDVHVTLTSSSPDQNMYGDFRTRDTYTWSLSFTMNVNFMGSFNEPKDIIAGAQGGGVDPAILINFYNDDRGDLTILPNDEPVSTIELP